MGADILDAGEVSLSALAASRQKKPLDTWTELYGSWIPVPVLFHPAFLPGLSPKDFQVLHALLAYSCRENLAEHDPVVNLRRHELQDRSGLGSGQAVTRRIQRLQASGYLTADSKPGHYDISPLMFRLEELAKEKMSTKRTFREMVLGEKMSTKRIKNVHLVDNASSDSPAISSKSRQSQPSKKASRGGASPSPAFSNSLPSSGRKAVSSSSVGRKANRGRKADRIGGDIRGGATPDSDEELTAADIPFGCSWNPMSEPAKGALVESEDILIERAEREAIREADNEAAQEREAIMADNL